MNDFVQSLNLTGTVKFILLAIVLFVITSIVLFIRDGILAKKQGRARKKIFTTMFIIAIPILGALGTMIIFGTLLHLISTPSTPSTPRDVGGAMRGM